MKVCDKIFGFYNSLSLDDATLPKHVKSLNPYINSEPEVWKVIEEFYHKFYDDENPRGLILGINPGRFGAGVTGIPFTDSFQLEKHCGIEFPSETRETSATFIYEMIEKYGGAKSFYADWFIGAVSPLGFIHKNDKGNWVNWNYYDEKELQKTLQDFIIENLKKQKELCGGARYNRAPAKCIVLGTGKNYAFVKKLNQEIGLFEEVIALEHPRYIMQYRLKQKEEFKDKYLKTLK